MDFSLLSELISPIIVLFCLAIGYVLKNLITTEKVNRWIPLIVGLLGIVCNVWYTGTFDFQTVIAGLISGLASTGLYETFKGFVEGSQNIPTTPTTVTSEAVQESELINQAVSVGRMDNPKLDPPDITYPL